jgi:hypothetical protein
MKMTMILISLLSGSILFAQQQTVSVAEEQLSLDQRFQLMKSRAQVYNEYRVIKDVVLDGVWKITKDSVNKSKANLAEARATIAQLENDIRIAKDNLTQKELSVAEVTFDSTHITVLGISFTKSVFILLVAGTVGALVFLVLGFWTSLKFARHALKEKLTIIDMTNHEYEDYKRKALGKEIKLARELQDERNKLHSLSR